MLPPPPGATAHLSVRLYRTLRTLGIVSTLILAVAAQTAQAQSTTVTFWPSSTVPSVPDSGPDSAVELGMKFSCSQAGTVTGLQFYKAATNTGTHTGHLWSSAGVSLASVTFTGETASGWQQANFATPVVITAGTTYTISYHTTVGHYSDATGFFSTALSVPPLSAPANAGVYVYGSGSSYPASVWQASNYWVQPIINTGPLPPAALSAVSVSPASVVGGNSSTGTVTLTSAAPASIVVTLSSTNATVPASVTVAAGSTTATFTVTTAVVTSTTSAVITASYNGVNATATLTETTVPVIAVTISPTSVTLAESGKQTFTATVTGTTTTTVTWSATGGSITSKGSYTAPKTAGTYTVTATSKANTAVSASATVTVTAPAVTVTISPTMVSLAANATQQFKATVTGGSPTTVTWSETGGSISTGGLYTAPGSAGTYTVTATSVANTAKSASATVTVTTAVSGNANLTVDASLTYQTMDGLGMNMNPDMWLNGQLEPALDLWTQTNGASLYRLTIECTDWVCPGCTLAQANAQIALLHNLDSATLVSTYETPKMQDLWNTIAYMNSKGIGGSQIVLNTQGWTATWMGGSGGFGSPSYITSGLEPQFATMWGSLAYYGRKVRGLSFTIIDPLNETDSSTGIEGPVVGTGQFATIFTDLVAEMAYMGLTDMTLTGPSTNGSSTITSYAAAMEGSSTVAANVKHLSFHSYTGSPASVPSKSYSGADYWLGETNPSIQGGDTGTCPGPSEWSWSAAAGDLILADLLNGFPAVMVWGGYDSYEPQEANPPVLNCWWYMSYSPSTGLFTPHNGFYVTASINHFIRPGAVRISANDSVSGGNTVAFYNPTNGQVSIVGHNTNGSSITINGQLKSLAATVTSLQAYFTNSTTNFQSQSSVPVSAGGAFTVTVPADTFFSLSNIDPLASGGANVIFVDNFTGTAINTNNWTVISRHGEYSQSETECNVPGMVTVNNGLTITTEKQSASCGDYFNTATSWPYITGDIQWKTFNFTTGTVEIYAKFPSVNTSLWPATWMLSSNCQYTNPLTGQTGVTIDGYSCPNLGFSGYSEIDMTECYTSTGWCQFHVANPGFDIGGGCDANYSVDTNWHVFTTVWTATSIQQYMDGVLKSTCNQVINQPMFLIIQTQTGGVGGTPANLPATLQVSYVKVTQP